MALSNITKNEKREIDHMYRDGVYILKKLSILIKELYCLLIFFFFFLWSSSKGCV